MYAAVSEQAPHLNFALPVGCMNHFTANPLLHYTQYNTVCVVCIIVCVCVCVCVYLLKCVPLVSKVLECQVVGYQ